MSQTLPLPPPGFDTLSVEEQTEYVEALWDHIAERPDQVPVPEWHQEIIAERLATERRLSDNEKTWEEFEQELADELSPPPGP